MPNAPQKIRIGRDASCDLVISDRSISRRHADLMIEPGGGLEILDRESSGGTYLVRDGQEHSISRARLRPTDSLKLGEYAITVQDLLERVKKLSAQPPPLPKKAPPPMPAASRVVFKEKPSPAAATGPVGTGRRVRCECGAIKERGAKCPVCGS